MAKFNQFVSVELNLNQPVQELQQTILFVSSAFPGQHETILKNLNDWLTEQLKQIEQSKQPEATQSNGKGGAAATKPQK